MRKVLLSAVAMALLITPVVAQTSITAPSERLTIKTKSSPPRTQGPEQGASGPGLVARGIEKKDIRRGMVIAKPGSIKPHTKQRANPILQGDPSPQGDPSSEAQKGRGVQKKWLPSNF